MTLKTLLKGGLGMGAAFGSMPLTYDDALRIIQGTAGAAAGIFMTLNLLWDWRKKERDRLREEREERERREKEESE